MSCGDSSDGSLKVSTLAGLDHGLRAGRQSSPRSLAGLSDRALLERLQEAYAENARLRGDLHDCMAIGHQAMTRGSRAELEARALASILMRESLSTLEGSTYG